MAEQHAMRREFDRRIAAAGTGLSSAIHELWRTRDETLWSADPWFHLRLAGIADDLGQAMFAHEVLEDARRCFPDHAPVTQRYCRSLVGGGFLHRARTLLDSLVKRGHLDEETLGILGRVHKEMWHIEGDGSPAHPHLAKARELYLGAFTRSRGAWSGINAASLSMIMGDRDRAARLAAAVVRICAARWNAPGQRDYWTVATAAEANLLLGRQETAATYYAHARRRPDATLPGLASTRRQLVLLARYLAVDPAILECLRLPPVAAFTGHLLDSPGHEPPRFPADAAEAVKRRLDAVLERLDVRIGYASAASGADVLFHECLRARGGESSVVLPFDRAEFLRVSVAAAGDPWVRRAERVLAGGPVEQATRGGYGSDDELFSYANRLVMGKAVLRSRALETEPVLIAVWDGAQRGAPGGTADCVATWRAGGHRVVVIDPARAVEVEPPPAPATVGAPVVAGRADGDPAEPPRRQTVAILFADLVGYSRLGEHQVPGYVRGFLAAIADTLRRRRLEPLYRNTWGDAICMVFAEAIEAADCALAVRDTVRRTDWSRHGLPRHLNLRIGLHAGPAYRLEEPLAERLNFFGFHVNQAARIEPITSPGNVYASEAFAALLALDPRNPFDCRHVGVVVLPKDFGSYPIYHIKRLTEVG